MMGKGDLVVNSGGYRVWALRFFDGPSLIVTASTPTWYSVSRSSVSLCHEHSASFPDLQWSQTPRKLTSCAIYLTSCPVRRQILKVIPPSRS